MKIGIVSDSHDNKANIAKAIKVFREKGVSYILHAGDIGSVSAGHAFCQVDGIKLIAVAGNCDFERDVLAEVVGNCGGEFYNEKYAGEICGKRIYMRHQPMGLESIANSGRYDLVIYGHTHKRDIHYCGECLVINPGKCRGWLMGDSSVVVLELDEMNYEAVPLK